MDTPETTDSTDDESVDSEWLDAASRALIAAARRSVGTLSVVDAQRLVRCVMFAHALERTSGNRHAAARLLGVDRRYVTRMAKAADALEVTIDAAGAPITRPS